MIIFYLKRRRKKNEVEKNFYEFIQIFLLIQLNYISNNFKWIMSRFIERRRRKKNHHRFEDYL